MILVQQEFSRKKIKDDEDEEENKDEDNKKKKSGKKDKIPLTPGVGTKWYKAPEIIFGGKHY